MMIWVLTLRRYFLADGGDRLIVHRVWGAIDDPRVIAVVGAGLQRVGQRGHQVVDGSVDRALAGCEKDGRWSAPGSPFLLGCCWCRARAWIVRT
jgi:hypothetical protein